MQLSYAYTYHRGDEIIIARTSTGLCYLAFTLGDRVAALARLRRRFVGATLTPTTPFDYNLLPIELYGSEFELSVWRALQHVGRGERASYSHIATLSGHPTAIRAVASAIGRNPIAIVIPCHRVVRRDGSIGGYAYGVDIKRRLIEEESLR